MEAQIDVYKYSDYKSFLFDEFERRRKLYKTYSLRSFSKDLGLRPTALSDILNERYGLSGTMAHRLAARIGLNSSSSLYFVSLVEVVHGRSVALRRQAEKRIKSIHEKSGPFRVLDEHEYFLMLKWYYPAILHLIGLEAGRISNEEIAGRLSLKLSEVDLAIEKLKEKGYLLEREGCLYKKEKNLSAESNISNECIKNFHSQVLDIVKNRIRTAPVFEKKSISTIMSFKSDKINSARQDLNVMSDNFFEKYESEEDADSIYVLSMHFVRLDQNHEK
jgi:uncharacterized protein (TIGR02147 family)